MYMIRTYKLIADPAKFLRENVSLFPGALLLIGITSPTMKPRNAALQEKQAAVA